MIKPRIRILNNNVLIKITVNGKRADMMIDKNLLNKLGILDALVWHRDALIKSSNDPYSSLPHTMRYLDLMINALYG